MNLAPILDDCLQRLQAGETIAGCLARHPDHAADLAPMLAVAAQLNRLAGQTPSSAQRQRALARLSQEAATQRVNWRSQKQPHWLTTVFAVRRLAAATAVILALLVIFSAGAVAASQPGQPAYELRVIVERAPALVAFKPAARVAVELEVADRRQADLQAYLTQAGVLDTTALRAMLAGDQAAAKRALAGAEHERLPVIERLTVRAGLLAELAESAPDPATAQTLNAAAHTTQALVQQLQASLAEPMQAPAQSTNAAPPGGSPTSTPTATDAVTATASPTPSMTASQAPLPAVAPQVQWTATPAASASAPTPSATATTRPRPRQTALAQTATALAQTPPPGETRTARPQQTATAMAQTPRPRQTATALALTATAQAATPSISPTATADAGNPEPTNAATAEPTATTHPDPPHPPGPRPDPTHTPGPRSDPNRPPGRP